MSGGGIPQTEYGIFLFLELELLSSLRQSVQLQRKPWAEQDRRTQQEESYFMKFLSCRIYCPFICFCKPSPHIHTSGSGPLKLQNGPQLPSTLVSVSNASDQSPAETTEVKDGSLVAAKGTGRCSKSSLRRVPSELEPKAHQKKKVQWVDFLGKELVEIREYESSEVDDTDREGDGNRGCVCVIL
ncbi:uncharacterized protein LOC116198538 isoform X1 [Punica granatum]|uniref:Uncharacterized protein LOC116198538 isoform X1 n=1 Tax=Punica granatum TaxID=22663 RepID=A0A6P8CQJ9_PUNGR|nr:uncharacterized protein LOC116198538 isoform X1 [Punica granatum]